MAVRRQRLASADLNRQVIHQRETLTEDGAGGQTRSWSEQGRPWVRAIISPGSQAAVAGMMQDRQTMTLQMRPRDIVSGDRVILGSETYRVRSAVDPDGMRERLQVLIELEVPEC